MRITWYGHAAFLIETQGLRIILDPYRSPDSGGYLPIDEPADMVIVSHEEDVYHSHIGQIVPPFELVKALEIPERRLGRQGDPVGDGARLRARRSQARGEGHDHPLSVGGLAPGLPRRPGPFTHRSRGCSACAGRTSC